MQYAILCYHDEAAVDALTQEQDDALMADLAVAGEALVAEGRLGPVARLMPTTAPRSATAMRRWSWTGRSPRPKKRCSVCT